VQYKIDNGKITRKLQYAATSGLGTIAAATVVIGYAIERIDPTLPEYMVAAIVSLVTGALVWLGTVGVGYFVRPSAADRPVPDMDADPQPGGIT